MFFFQTKINRILPFVVIGLVAVISALLSFILPETKDQPIKDTIQSTADEDENKNKKTNKINGEDTKV